MKLLLIPLFLFTVNDFFEFNTDKFLAHSNIIHNTFEKYENNTNHTAECALCETLVDIIDHDIKYGNQTFNKIKKVIEFICDETTDPIGNKECHIVLDDLQTILNWLTRGMPTSQICHRLGFCNTTIVSVS